MSLGSSNMAGTALGTALSLLLHASIIQGLQDAKMVEAVEGQNVTLPCVVKSLPNLKIVSYEWSKKGKENIKMALYSYGHGVHLFWHNVTIQIQNNDTDHLKSSHLHLPAVKTWDSGIYICDITTFPHGSIRRETELKIKEGIKVMCDANSTVDVYSGENVTIQCNTYADAQFRWTKNKTLVSEDESLKLCSVTDAQSGVYTLTVSTGTESLHREFTITVLTATTSLRTDFTTVLPQTYVTEEDLTEPTSSLTTSLTTGLSTTDTNVTWTMSSGTSVTDDNPNLSNVTITHGEHATSGTNYTHQSVTSSPATHTDPDHLLNSTTLSYSSTVFRSTQEGDRTKNESTPHTANPEDIISVRPQESGTLGNITQKYEIPGINSTLRTGSGVVAKDTARSHLVVLIIIPTMVLIVVAGFLYRRHLIKKRMALPPPFKPPPPPVKYTAARHQEISTQPFPTSRCNSVQYV
ncbi:T-cell surface protein tactile [Lates calcarifer]|uniref:T-cell surface protein tactile n=1 Tax=Lates calcarifer TaxID=8187 RepID=A0AAJ7Q6J6_LATCA|nr:T-cell surface protein tactile [Lates calcarifer]